ncbi:Kv channel-interacting protein 1 isoform X2 [Nematostella vectensis]|uniref:Kv channel-interacting protein 1 isoform X2 n=1 Tax=Nematostella vectensis TaxID=45351 RepID=UPI00138F9D9D|nr:Kv channel-interacting protein 1 isoform X2 [Nematostella vectensis]
MHKLLQRGLQKASRHTSSEATAEESRSMLGGHGLPLKVTHSKSPSPQTPRKSRSNTVHEEISDSTGGQNIIGIHLEGLEDLLIHTKFTRLELQRMYRGFKNECPSGAVDRDTFKRIYAQFFPYGDSAQYAQLLFNVFDHNKDGKVSFEDFVLGLSVSLHGTMDEKLKWAFNLYDLDSDGVITREELATVIHSVHCMMGMESQPTGEESSVQEQVERLFTLMDTNQDGVITEDEFIEGCKKDDSIKKSLAVFESDR